MATTQHNKLSLLCFISIFFLLSPSKRASLSSPNTHRSSSVFTPKSDGSRTDISAVCDFSEGSWIYDQGCDLPSFESTRISRYSSKCQHRAGFVVVGDSLNRNMFVSLFCMLKSVATSWCRSCIHIFAYHRTNLLARYGGQLMPMVVSYRSSWMQRGIQSRC
ncbi:unnamed protein product [Microthlaspi erraticum]|uniref:Trichome birefringence-like N-terminal domain-containing protein n=1 Tax=Microthlaspi erraticum TaxID=1685480 RepID=A0A6D2L1P9_9BRAS|nr:unnamed protein product [Microthlaspi erraticum]